MYTDTATIELKLHNIIVEHLCVTPEEVVPTAGLTEDLGADSLDMVELGIQCEEAFDTQFADSDMVKVKTVQDMVDLVKSKVG